MIMYYKLILISVINYVTSSKNFIKKYDGSMLSAFNTLEDIQLEVNITSIDCIEIKTPGFH